ncbi:hypothetical protein DFH08DRAFT_962952 [Mycena albidolilacea]|uniref:Uncharacterized protein n=1 Tax=Mycena albidolilacea TaxID=1033008 RepID=A0AAD6ZWF6_9AGAR|nr:hypothetical protein DFH08DRAFT_962952 [Mycena albidolilacea]
MQIDAHRTTDTPLPVARVSHQIPAHKPLSHESPAQQPSAVHLGSVYDHYYIVKCCERRGHKRATDDSINGAATLFQAIPPPDIRSAARKDGHLVFPSNGAVNTILQDVPSTTAAALADAWTRSRRAWAAVLHLRQRWALRPQDARSEGVALVLSSQIQSHARHLLATTGVVPLSSRAASAARVATAASDLATPEPAQRGDTTADEITPIAIAVAPIGATPIEVVPIEVDPSAFITAFLGSHLRAMTPAL